MQGLELGAARRLERKGVVITSEAAQLHWPTADVGLTCYDDPHPPAEGQALELRLAPSLLVHRAFIRWQMAWRELPHMEGRASRILLINVALCCPPSSHPSPPSSPLPPGPPEPPRQRLSLPRAPRAPPTAQERSLSLAPRTPYTRRREGTHLAQRSTLHLHQPAVCLVTTIWTIPVIPTVHLRPWGAGEAAKIRELHSGAAERRQCYTRATRAALQ